MTRQRNLRRGAPALVLAWALACAAQGPAWADEQVAKPASAPVGDKTGAKPRVAVLEFPKVQPALSKALARGGDYQLLGPAEWNPAARQLNATGHAADEIAVVATELKADAVVTVTVKKDKDGGGWVLTLSGRHGPTGKVVEKKKYPLKSQKVDKATLAQMAEDVGPLVAQALKGPPAEPVAQAEAPKLTPDAPAQKPPGNEDEDPLKRLAKADEEEKKKQSKERPRWYPFIDIDLGIGVEVRRFTFEEDASSNTRCYDFTGLVQPSSAILYNYQPRSPCPGFKWSVAPLIRLDATFYPLAFVAANAVRGLGLGITADFPIWPDSKAPSGTPLGTTELRIEGGLRWAWNIVNKRNRPSLLVSLQYGLHSFAIQKEDTQNVSVPNPATGGNAVVTKRDDHGQPDIGYQYIDVGLGARVPFLGTERSYLGMVLDLHYHAMLSHGEIASSFPAINGTPSVTDIQSLYLSSGYGPVSGSYGLRVGLTPVEWIPWKGLTLRVTGYYEMFAMNFDLANPSSGMTLPSQGNMLPVSATAARHVASSATDYYIGAMAQVGWQY